MDTGTLELRAKEAERLLTEGRNQLVAAVREAHTSGMSQRQIAKAVGRSQPEVNRLIRFHGHSQGGILLRRNLSELRAILTSEGLSNPRVFGSTARGQDTEGSDIDLLVTPSMPLSLMDQARIGERLHDLLGVPVDLVLDNALRADLRDQILSEAVPL